jgi:uncharacterized membrane protein
MPSWLANLVPAAAIVAYEAGARYAVATPGAHGIGLALVLTPPLALGFGLAVRSAERMWLGPLWIAACALLWQARGALAAHFGWGLYLEHLCFNLAMALLFGRTLAPGRQPLCTRLAVRIHGTITPTVERYTRRITLAWTLFFLATAAVSTLLFAAATLDHWSIFANYLSLPLVGAMFVAEQAYRRHALPNEPGPRIAEMIRAYRQTR